MDENLPPINKPTRPRKAAQTGERALRKAFDVATIEDSITRSIGQNNELLGRLTDFASERALLKIIMTSQKYGENLYRLHLRRISDIFYDPRHVLLLNICGSYFQQPQHDSTIPLNFIFQELATMGKLGDKAGQIANSYISTIAGDPDVIISQQSVTSYWDRAVKIWDKRQQHIIYNTAQQALNVLSEEETRQYTTERNMQLASLVSGNGSISDYLTFDSESLTISFPLVDTDETLSDWIVPKFGLTLLDGNPNSNKLPLFNCLPRRVLSLLAPTGSMKTALTIQFIINSIAQGINILVCTSENYARDYKLRLLSFITEIPFGWIERLDNRLPTPQIDTEDRKLLNAWSEALSGRPSEIVYRGIKTPCYMAGRVDFINSIGKHIDVIREEVLIRNQRYRTDARYNNSPLRVAIYDHIQDIKIARNTNISAAEAIEEALLRIRDMSNTENMLSFVVSHVNKAECDRDGDFTIPTLNSTSHSKEIGKRSHFSQGISLHPKLPVLRYEMLKATSAATASVYYFKVKPAIGHIIDELVDKGTL